MMEETEEQTAKPGKTRRPAGLVKKETVLLVGIACLLVGFVAGIAFTVYKGQGRTAAQQGSGAPAERLSEEQSRQILQLEAEVEKTPDKVEAWTNLGHLYFDSDQPEKAINAYTKSLALAPGNPDVLTDLGVMYRKIGKPEQAIASFDQAIAINPGHETARFNKGVVLLYDMQNKAGGIAVWQELVAINPMATAPNGQMVSEIIQELKK